MPAALGPGYGTGQAAAGGDGDLPQEGFAPERSRGGWRAGPRGRSRHPDEEAAGVTALLARRVPPGSTKDAGLTRFGDERVDDVLNLALFVAGQLLDGLEAFFPF